MHNIIEDLNWRYATKKFDADKKLSEEQRESILEAVSLSASSYGLQPVTVLVIEGDAELRSKLREASWGQSQIEDASAILVFCAHTDISADSIDALMNRTSEARGIPAENLKGYGDFMKSKLTVRSAEDLTNWASRQAYIALGNLLTTAAVIRVDSCPIEGFEPEKYDEILGLSEKNLRAAVVAAVGFRSEEDTNHQLAKVRKGRDEFFKFYN